MIKNERSRFARLAALVLIAAMVAAPGARAEPFLFTLNGNFYGGFSLSGAPIADGTAFTETATFDTSTPNLLGIPGTAVYAPSTATITFGGTTYQITPYSAQNPFGVTVAIFDRSSPFPAVPEYGVGLVGNNAIAGALIQKTLQLRARLPDFANLEYQPIIAQGAKADHVFGLMRGESVIAIIPRFLLKLNRDWQETALELPAGNWHHELTGENFTGEIRMEHLFRKFPVALLSRKEND